MATPNRAPGWGRGPLVVAGIIVACLLGALLGIVFAALGHRNELAGLLFAVGLILLALLLLAVLVIVLVRDRFPREVLARLTALEVRLDHLRPPDGGETERAVPPAPAPPVAPPAPPAPEPAPPAVATARPPEAGSVPPPPDAPRPAVRPPAATPPTPPRLSGTAGRGGAPTPSFEMMLGGRALAVVGVVVLVIAIGLFLKFGWDQGWFRPTPPVRVALGVVTGLALLAGGEWARRMERYRILSQVLTAGGIGALYLSAWAAHGLYRLVGAGPSFLLLAAAAGLGVTVATATRGRVLASLATAAGLLVPVVVTLPDGPPTPVYGFLLVVVAAVLPVAAARGWPELGVLALAGVALDAGRAFSWQWPTPDGRLVDAAFLVAAMVVFFGLTLGHAWRRRVPPGRIELIVLAAASLGGWAAGLARLEPLGEVTGGVWTVVVLLLELVAAHLILVRLGATAAGRRLFLGLALVLMTALPPVLWDGAPVAAAWAVEALALVLAARAPEVGYAATLVTAMAAVAAVDSASGSEGFLSVAGGLRLLAAAALAGALVVVERRSRSGPAAAWSTAIVAAPAAALTLLAWLVPALRDWAEAVAAPSAAPGVAGAVLSLLLAVAGGAVLAAWPWRPAPATTLTGVALVTACLLWDGDAGTLGRWHAAAASAPLTWTAAAIAVIALRAGGSDREGDRWIAVVGAAATAAAAFAWRVRMGWPGHDVTLGGVLPAALCGAAAVLLLLAARPSRDWRTPPGPLWLETAGWVSALAAASRLLATAVALASSVGGVEARRVALVSLSVLWGGAGLALVLTGLIGRAAHRRHLGLALLGLTVAKVFLFDLASAPTVLRIVAFLATGLALLAGAYLYARFRERLEAGG